LRARGVEWASVSADLSDGIHDFLLNFWGPVGNAAKKLFKFVRHGELVTHKSSLISAAARCPLRPDSDQIPQRIKYKGLEKSPCESGRGIASCKRRVTLFQRMK
jgi:hypothetical protein